MESAAAATDNIEDKDSEGEELLLLLLPGSNSLSAVKDRGGSEGCGLTDYAERGDFEK